MFSLGGNDASKKYQQHEPSANEIGYSPWPKLCCGMGNSSWVEVGVGGCVKDDRLRGFGCMKKPEKQEERECR